ncbi:hypothetical protein OG944_04080 [Streptomyces anulatus]|uniref:hypothetical protein n=2 Tax=Streptomyces TaxID=1883 RepID=UPI00224F818B|nr:hypothetical protein [Streptomyces anulatus]MCX4502179.1 hypothetical protein [Streptomyces anulatus]WTC75281.1 hypothetical protein OG882_35055 [Streptomyces anulatus]
MALAPDGLTEPIRGESGRPKVIDDDMLTFAVALKGTPVPEIAKKLVIKNGKNAGEHSSVASVYRALADAEEAAAAAVDDGLPLRPTRVQIRRPSDPLTPEELDLRQRLVTQRAELDAGQNQFHR